MPHFGTDAVTVNEQNPEVPAFMNTWDSTSKNEIGTVFAYDERYSFLKGIPMLIRTAELSDLPALLAIYNDEVKNGVATFDTEPQTMEERRAWFDAHNVENHPLLTRFTSIGRCGATASAKPS